MNWKEFNDSALLNDDTNYLVSWKDCEGRYSTFHRAYYTSDEKKFFSLENNNSHPLIVDAFLEIPKIIDIFLEVSNVDYMDTKNER